MPEFFEEQTEIREEIMQTTDDVEVIPTPMGPEIIEQEVVRQEEIIIENQENIIVE
jgi:hypothetical protein